jgi:transposase
MPVRYNQDTKAKAIRLVREHAGDYPSEYVAITAVAGRLGMSAETLRKWIRQAQVDEGRAAGVTSSESAEIRELRRKNRELEQTIEIFGYTAFCIDAFAGLIAGWECSLSKQTAFVEKAIRQAAALRSRQGHPGQYSSVRFAETLMLAGLAGSVGSVGDAYDKTWASYCTSWCCCGVNSAGELAALAFDQPGVGGVGRVEQRGVLVGGLAGGEQPGAAPGLDGGDVHSEPRGYLGHGEQAAGAQPVGVTGQVVALA